MEKLEIEKKANDLLMTHNINAQNGFDIVLLAKEMGFVVGNAQMDDNEDGLIAVDENRETLFGTSSNKVIAVNKNRDYYFKRFVIAHELGHYVLDGLSGLLYAHRENSAKKLSDSEQDVDYFAACLLMPGDAFSAKYHEINHADEPISKIAERLQKVFEVPLTSIIRRLEELNLVGKAESKAEK